MANPMRASERFFTISSHYVNASERRDFFTSDCPGAGYVGWAQQLSELGCFK
jgi:hypothetical protein